MQIAKTKEESDLLCEQEISHILKLEEKPIPFLQENKINFAKQCFFELPERVSMTTIKTKKYGVLCLFDKISDLLASKYNKGIIAVYCRHTDFVKRKRTTNKIVSLSTWTEYYEFEDREFGNASGLYLNDIEKIEQYNGYLLFLERNKHTQNGVQIISNFKLKS